MKRAQRVPGLPHSAVTSIQDMSPDEMDVTLGYPILGQIADATTFHSAKRWQPNAAYDVDPLLGSTSTPGFSEWASLYSYYRVYSYEVDVQVTNLDAQPYGLYFLNTNTDPGLSGTDYFDYASGPYCKRSMLSIAGGGSDTIHHKMTVNCAKVLGSIAIETSDSTRAVVTSVPADLLFTGIGVRSATATNMVSGVVFNGVIRMKIRFYGRQNLLTTLSPQAKLFEEERLRRKARPDLHDDGIANQHVVRSSPLSPGVVEQQQEKDRPVEALPLSQTQIEAVVTEAVSAAMEDLALKCVTLSMNAVVKAMANYQE